MNYDQAINLIWDAGFDGTFTLQSFYEYMTTIDPNLDITVDNVSNQHNDFLIIKIKIIGGYVKITLRFEHAEFLSFLHWHNDEFIEEEDEYDDRDDPHLFDGEGMYEPVDEIPIYPHLPPGRFYRDKVGHLKDDEGHILKEMDGIAFDNDTNVIGYDPKVYPSAPTSEQIEQAKLNIFTDEMMNSHEIIRNYVPYQRRKHIRTKRKINQIGSQRPASEWEIDEYLRNYKGPGV